MLTTFREGIISRKCKRKQIYEMKGLDCRLQVVIMGFPEDGGSKFRRNVVTYLPKYMASQRIMWLFVSKLFKKYPPAFGHF
jgi:hypothetical protein